MTLTTAVSVLAAIALLLPGFIVVELSAARGARSSRSDLELALRALAYALIIHLLFIWWTALLADRIDDPVRWREHVSAIALYAAVVLVGVPLLLGVLINRGVAHAEGRDGSMPLWASALGAGEARDAYDYAWQRLSKTGGWVIVELVGHTAEAPKLIGGRYGERSAIGQSPSDHDLYLEQLCFVYEGPDGLRRLVGRTEPERGVYIAASQIARFEILPPRPDTLGV